MFFIALLVVAGCASPPHSRMSLEEREWSRKQCLTGFLSDGRNGTNGHRSDAAAEASLRYALAWGNCLSLHSDFTSRPAATYRRTALAIHYTPSQGHVAGIQEYVVNPLNVAPGDTVSIRGAYYVMGPESSGSVRVTETRGVKFIKHNTDAAVMLGEAARDVSTTPGSRRFSGTVDIPDGVPEGRYSILFRIASAGVEASEGREIIVKRHARTAGLRQETVSGSSAQSGTRSSAKQQDRSQNNGIHPSRIEIKSKTLNVRQEPNTVSRVVYSARQGELYTVLDASPKNNPQWYKIRLADGKSGWVAKRYVSESARISP